MFSLQVLYYKALIKVLKVLLHLLPIGMPLIYSGRGAHLQLAGMIANTDCQSVLLVTDKGLTQLGLYNSLVETLNDKNIDVHIFDDITPDPTDEQINLGYRIALEKQCDLVIGFGGGSAMDAAKLISVLPKVNKPLSKLVGVLKVRKKGLPLYLVPTTAGTGSEVTIAAVVTDKNSGQKMPVADPVLVPTAAALDPELMQGLPKSVTAATGFDALTHAVEAYISTNATTQTDFYAKTAARLIWDNLQTCVDNPDDLVARESMAIASCYAGLAFTKAGVGYAHGIAHQLGAHYHVPHGEANALVLPHILKFSYPKCINRLAQLGRCVGLDDGNVKSDEQLATEFVDGVFTLQSSLGLPTALPDLLKEHYPSIAKAALKESHNLYAVPRYMTKQQCFSLLDAIAAK